MKLKLEWVSGNRVDLLENGDTYFPAVFDAIDAAEREVLIEVEGPVVTASIASRARRWRRCGGT